MRIHLPLALVAIAAATPSLAGETPAAPRAGAQAGAKEALSATKLTVEQVDAVYSELTRFAHRYATHVLTVGGAAARQEDLEDVVEAGLRQRLEAAGMSAADQQAVLLAAEKRAKAALEDYDRTIDAQARIKRTLASAYLEDDVETAVLHEAVAFVGSAHAWVTAPGVFGEDREPAKDVADREFGPVLERAELSDSKAREILDLMSGWLEARAALEYEASP